MLANIKTLEPILDKLFKENGTFGLMQDNGEFPKRLKLLASAFDYKCTNDSLDTFKDFCYNLFYKDGYVDANEQGVVKWNDPEYQMEWPTNNPTLQKRDR